MSTGQSFWGLSKLVLNNSYADPTYMKEALSYDLMDYLGIPAPLCTYAEVTVNGEPFGLYLLLEAVEEEFAERSFGGGYGPALQAGIGGRRGPRERQRPRLQRRRPGELRRRL